MVLLVSLDSNTSMWSGSLVIKFIGPVDGKYAHNELKTNINTTEH